MTNRKHRILRFARRTLALLLAAATLLPAAACAKKKPYLSETKFVLNTTCTISLYDKQDQKVLSGAFALLTHFDNLFSTTVTGSDIYRINHAGGKPVKVDADTLEVIRSGIRYSELSGGLFDITVGALTSLWNIEGAHPKVPAPSAIKAAVKTIGYKNIVLAGDTVALKNPRAQIDLGGVAKGFIADKVKAYLLSKGVHSAIINLGGNVLTVGSKGKNDPFVVGVQQPFQDRNEDIGYLYVSDRSVVTSGIYERYFVQDGKLYAHILDPRTGYPVQNDLNSVTIVSDISGDGDGLSATCFLLGVEKAAKLIESLKDTEAIFILKNGKVVKTSGIGRTVKFVPASESSSE